MNNGISIVELAQKIQDIENSKKDLLAPTTRMKMTNGNRLIVGDGTNANEFHVSDLAHDQIGSRLGIPRDYYRRMQAESPELLDKNVNEWFVRKPEKRLVRTYNGNVRAFLSERYAPKENITVMGALLPVLEERKNDVQILSSNLSERNLFIKAISHELTGEVRVGQIVKGGISIRNSEVGCGAFDCSLFIYVLACMNGMIREHSMRSCHIGKKIDIESDDQGIGIYSQETIEANSHLFGLQVRDTLQYAFNKEKFELELENFRRAAENPLNPKAIPETIEDITKRFTLTQNEGKDILSRLLEGKDFTQWGLSNAITNLAGDIEDYDRATELEKIGGHVVDLRPADWRMITKLAA